jgi:hypothetical protein
MRTWYSSFGCLDRSRWHSKGTVWCSCLIRTHELCGPPGIQTTLLAFLILLIPKRNVGKANSLQRSQVWHFMEIFAALLSVGTFPLLNPIRAPSFVVTWGWKAAWRLTICKRGGGRWQGVSTAFSFLLGVDNIRKESLMSLALPVLNSD